MPVDWSQSQTIRHALDIANTHSMPPRHEIFEGQSWMIEERHHAGVWSLIFSTEGITRRVWHYPADWRALGASELFQLTYSPAAIRRRVTSLD
jgi:hypothetical protein